MKTLILFYSQTGTTAKVAASLSRALAATTAEIGCPRYQKSWAGPALLFYDCMGSRIPAIDVPEIAFGTFDLLVLGAPVWASLPATPLSAFLQNRRDLPARVALVLTHDAPSTPDKAIRRVADHLPQGLERTLGVCHQDVANNRFSSAVEDFAAALRRGVGPKDL
ncbi:MAG: flavodoxin family protein [Alphaproteobacteria bacterium]